MLLYPLLALILTVLSMPLCIWLARRYRLYDVPDELRKMHEGDVPFTGGYGIIIALSVCFGIMLLVDGTQHFLVGGSGYNGMYPYIAEATVIIIVLGIIDDLRDLTYSQKFFFQFMAASLMILGAIKSHLLPQFFSLESSGVLLNSVAMIVSLLWIVGTTNAINMIDGMDGLAGGTSLISATALGIVALLWGNPAMGLILFTLAGAIFGFLAFNIPPARVFMGDGGSMFIGFTLAICGWMLIDSGPSTLTSYTVPIIILGLPVSDTLLAFFRRIVKGKNPFSADLLHIHHMLRSRQEFSATKTVLVLCGVALFYALAGIVVAITSTLVGAALIIALLIAKLSFLRWLGYMNALKDEGEFFRTENILPLNGNGRHHRGALNGNGRGDTTTKEKRTRYKS